MAVDFALDMRKLIAKVSNRADEVTRKTVLAVGTSLVLKSPVGDPELWKEKPPKGYVGGRFRANWQHGFNIAPSGTEESIDAEGTETIDGIGTRISQCDVSGIHYLVNNLPYANALEYGHSSQVPNGMVGLTTAEFEQYVEQAVSDSP